MNTREVLLLISVALFWLFILWVSGAGVLPLLKSLTSYTEEKREMARKAIVGIDAHFADSPSVVGNVVHEVAKGLAVSPTDPLVVAASQSAVLAEILKMVNLALPQTPDSLSPETLAQAVNDVLGVVGRVTDNVKGNVFDKDSGAG